jgi:hypothetical protein
MTDRELAEQAGYTPQLSIDALQSFAGGKIGNVQLQWLRALARAFPGGMADRLLTLEAGYGMALGDLMRARAEVERLQEQIATMQSASEFRRPNSP